MTFHAPQTNARLISVVARRIAFSRVSLVAATAIVSTSVVLTGRASDSDVAMSSVAKVMIEERIETDATPLLPIESKPIITEYIEADSADDRFGSPVQVALAQIDSTLPTLQTPPIADKLFGTELQLGDRTSGVLKPEPSQPHLDPSTNSLRYLPGSIETDSPPHRTIWSVCRGCKPDTSRTRLECH